MTNIAFGSKYFIFSKFSSIPKTSKIEQNRANLVKEFSELNEFLASDELKNHLGLEKYLNSKEHKDLMASIQNQKAKELDKTKSYEVQQKSKRFRDYFKFKDSPALKNYYAFSESKELSDYLALEKLVSSKEFSAQKKTASDQKAVEDKKINEFNSLKKSKVIKGYFKFRDSAKLKEFNGISDSQELSNYFDLEKYLNSAEFKKAKKDTDPKVFKDTTAGKKEQEFETLKRSGKIKFYFKFKDSPKYKNYLSFEKSSELKKYRDLEEYLSSADHKEKLTKATNVLAETNGKEKEYQQKKNSADVKNYFKFQNSQKFKDFQAFEKSKELADYLELEKYLASKERKEIMETLAEKEKAENEKIKKYEEFKNSKIFKWYVSVKDSNKFDEFKRWELIFEDDFSESKLNREKWLTRYYWGDKLLNDAYAFEHDKAFPTDGENLELASSTLRIITRKEKMEGKAWKQPFGFIPKEFDYTTGLISTAKSHRQKFGKFEAKIKVNYAKPVNYNFWMASEKNLPHVDILKLDKKKTQVAMAHHYGNVADKKGPESSKSEFSGLDVSQDYFIYTLEWNKDKLIWKINDVVVNQQTKGIPQEEMYLVFSSSITDKADGGGLPASMDIDWVRCYKPV